MHAHELRDMTFRGSIAQADPGARCGKHVTFKGTGCFLCGSEAPEPSTALFDRTLLTISLCVSIARYEST